MAPSIIDQASPQDSAPSSKKPSSSSSDPSVYSIHHAGFSSQPFPSTTSAWLARASLVSSILASDAAARDIANASPVAEISLLKSSGLLKVLGPVEYGGGGQSWEVGYKVTREVAKGDGSIGMLLGYHLLWSKTADIVGSEEQKDRFQKLIIENNYFVGGAVNPRDNDLSITDEGENIIFNGSKHFNTGGVISDLTVLEGVLSGTSNHIFAIVPTSQPGFTFAHNWNNIGLRLTESGSVNISNISVPWKDALGWNATTKAPDPTILNIPFASLLLPTIQLVFSNFYLGIAQGSLEFAKRYTTTNTRAWPFGGDNKASATEEFYILERYGSFHATLLAAEALTDRAGQEISALYLTYSTTRSITARQRGEIAELVAAAKVATTESSLNVTAGVFEVTGSRATGKTVGLDRFWRDVRTHTLHDPVAYKKKELGRFFLLDEVPEPTWYT
ncbi:thermophilic desulfurizing enzyme family protein [Aureobasidium subglaciale]|nr:thermophilic desulfurizing enzyme family protein [Aureobasidium subglaciale]